MKLNKLVILPLLSMTLLLGCNQPVEEGLVTITLPKEQEVEKGGVGGHLIDIGLGYALESNASYECSFTPTITNKTITVTSSRPQSLTVEMIGQNVFKLISHKPGDSILTIKNANNIIKYNKVVHVRDPYTPESILQAVYDKDVYTSSGIYGGYRFSMTTLEDNKAIATITGGERYMDEFGNPQFEASTKSVFNLTFKEVDNDEPFNGHFYRFEAAVDEEKTDLSYNITCVYISLCADRILPYYLEPGDGQEHLFEVFDTFEKEYTR